jgi:sugar O-acyltransferase (sialic acid O-acetyltransferase NeuD family)
MPERIFIFGASGHAKVVLDAARLQGYEVCALFDDNPALAGGRFMDCAVVGGRDVLSSWCKEQGVSAGIVAIGQNRPRVAVAESLRAAGLRLVSVVHPGAIVAAGVRIGSGCVLMAGVVVNSDAVLGDDCIVNTGACIDHDCELGDGVHVAPGCHLCGNVRVGAESLVGAGSTVIPGIRIGARALVGAGSTVIRDVPDDARVAGSPCRELK